MKILILRFSSIGDIVLTSPIVRCIKNQIPDSILHYATKEIYASIVQCNPHIDKVHLLGNNLYELINDLRQERFDIIIDLHKNLRTLRVKRSLGIKSFTFKKLNLKKWLFVNFKKNNLPNIHIVDRYFDAVQKLNVINDLQGIDFNIPSAEEINVLEKFKISNYIAVALGAQYQTKCLPKNKLIEVLSQLKQPIILLGGSMDIELGTALTKELLSQKVINLAGKLSIAQSASIIKQANVLLTHDTGLMHIASAFDTPIVTVWGNTVPEFGMYAYRPELKENIHNHQVKNLKCRPCSKIGFNDCPKIHFNCMQNQNSQEIIGSLKNYLQSK